MLKAIRRLFAYLAALGALSTGLAVQAGRWSDRLDVANHFAPWVLAGTIVLAVLALWAPRGPARRVALILTLAGMLLCAERVLPTVAASWRQPDTEAPGPTLKIVQFNLWVENDDPAGSLRWILAQDADVVVVQEAGQDARPIRKGLMAAYPHWSSCRTARPCSTMIFSRLPLEDRGPLRTPPGAWARYRWRDRAFTVVGVHFFWPYPVGEQRRQARALAGFLAQHPDENLILVGDFNAAPWSFSLQRQTEAYGLQRRTQGVHSWPAKPYFKDRLPAPFPYLPIDQVFAGKGWRTVSVERGPRLGSDHYPVVVELAPR